MNASPRLTQLIDAFESCRLVAYWDGTYLDKARTQKRWSLGWGTTRLSGRLVAEGDTCSQDQADSWRDADIAAHAASVNAELAPIIATWDADPATYQDRFDSLCDFDYNLGDGEFKGSGLRRLVLAGLPSAADEFVKWTLADGKRSNGLLRRRLAERALFVSDFRPDGSLRTEKADFPNAVWYPTA